MDYFADVVIVRVRPKLIDGGLAHLGGLPNLEWLHLNGTLASDAGLVHLSG